MGTKEQDQQLDQILAKSIHRLTNYDVPENFLPGYYPAQSRGQAKQPILTPIHTDLTLPKSGKTSLQKDLRYQEKANSRLKKLAHFYGNLESMLSENNFNPLTEALLYQQIEIFFSKPEPKSYQFLQSVADQVRRIIRKYKDPRNHKKKYSTYERMQKSVRITCLGEIYIFLLKNKPKQLVLTAERFRNFLYSCLRIEGLGEEQKFIPKNLNINIKRRGYDVLNTLSGCGAIHQIKDQKQETTKKNEDIFQNQNDHVISKQYFGLFLLRESQRQFLQMIDILTERAEKTNKELKKHNKLLLAYQAIISPNNRRTQNELTKFNVQGEFFFLEKERAGQLEIMEYDDLEKQLQNIRGNSLDPVIIKVFNQSNMQSSDVEDENLETRQQKLVEEIKKEEEEQLKLIHKFHDLQDYDHDLQLFIEFKFEQLKQLEQKLNEQKKHSKSEKKPKKQPRKSKQSQPAKISLKPIGKTKNIKKANGRKKKISSDDSDQQYAYYREKKVHTKKRNIPKRSNAQIPNSKRKKAESRKNVMLPSIQEILSNEAEQSRKEPRINSEEESEESKRRGFKKDEIFFENED